MQMMAAGIGMVCFLWFAVPLFAGVFHIGNATGMAVSGVLTLYGIYRKEIDRMICILWERRGGKLALSLFALFAAIVLIIVVTETVLMARAATKRPSDGVMAVVLGCRVNGVCPSTVLQERLNAAYEYLMDHPKVFCILSGGQGEGEEISEAECMYRYLRKMGIEKMRLIKEDASTTTAENLLFSKRLMQRYGLGNRITIITSEFHAYRACAMAERLGLSAYSVPSRTFFVFLPTCYVRELYGIVYYMIRK